jgi:hypothetical protein
MISLTSESNFKYTFYYLNEYTIAYATRNQDIKMVNALKDGVAKNIKQMINCATL